MNYYCYYLHCCWQRLAAWAKQLETGHLLVGRFVKYATQKNPNSDLRNFHYQWCIKGRERNITFPSSVHRYHWTFTTYLRLKAVLIYIRWKVLIATSVTGRKRWLSLWYSLLLIRLWSPAQLKNKTTAAKQSAFVWCGSCSHVGKGAKYDSEVAF